MTGGAGIVPKPDLRRFAAWAIVILAVAASVTSIGNGFALDDVHIIALNERIHSVAGWHNVFVDSYWPPEKGGALYRPLTSLAFVLQWFAGGGSPLVFHIVSIALYALVSVCVLRLAEALTDWPAAWLAAALFAVHPLHVEVVANVVGQAELWAAMLAIPAVTLFIRARRNGEMSRHDIARIGALYGGALMFKEHVVVLPVIVIAAELLVVGRASMTEHARRVAPVVVVMTAVAVSFIVVRTVVLDDLEGAGVSPIFAGYGYETRFFTMLRVMMEWVRLFFWPARLATDYAPLIELASSFELEMMPAVAVIGAAVAIAWAVRRSHPAATFALAWAGITLLIPSNLMVVTGFVLAERALFLASAGMMIALAIAIHAMVKASPEMEHSRKRVVGVAVAAVLAMGILRSSERNPAWRDNASLIERNVADLPLSWHAHMMMSQLHSDRGDRQRALDEARIAVSLGSRTDHRLLAFAADMFQMHGRCDLAMGYYERSLSLVADQPQVRNNASICAGKARRQAVAQ